MHHSPTARGLRNGDISWSNLDVCALGDGVRGATAGDLGPDERAAAARSLDAATAIWKRNSRLAGDRHKRNALWKWMYRGI